MVVFFSTNLPGGVDEGQMTEVGICGNTYNLCVQSSEISHTITEGYQFSRTNKGAVKYNDSPEINQVKSIKIM